MPAASRYGIFATEAARMREYHRCRVRASDSRPARTALPGDDRPECCLSPFPYTTFEVIVEIGIVCRPWR